VTYATPDTAAKAGFPSVKAFMKARRLFDCGCDVCIGKVEGAGLSNDAGGVDGGAGGAGGGSTGNGEKVGKVGAGKKKGKGKKRGKGGRR
jgi:hypothetical protein